MTTRDPLQQEDERFHSSYDSAREHAAEHTPVLVFFDGQFFFSDGEQRAQYPASAPGSAVLKAAAHAPIGVFTALMHETALTPTTRERLSKSQRALSEAEGRLGQSGTENGLNEAACADAARVLHASHEFVSELLAQQRVDAAHLESFARQLGPQLLRLTEHATELELRAIHEATEAALEAMNEKQRAGFEVVIAGAHQARDRSVPLQYFQQRFGEAAGEERRVAYAESVGSPEEARALVGTRRLDRKIASAFFGNPKRLQRDVLGDAAASLLKNIAFSRLR
ncbi:MAG TPA: hypothetical protein VFN67_30625 [Polyangiales bacterium]|nr:hypothetical protein [Polyangiales bacterium]